MKSETIRSGHSLRTKLLSGMVFTGAAALLLVAAPRSAHAFTAYSNDGLEINLTTTVGYSGGERINNPSSAIIYPNRSAQYNTLLANDGDNNFKHGMVSNQFEVVPVLSVTDGNFGLHVSGEAYLDTAYLQQNTNNSPSTLNYFVSNNRDFPRATRNIDGRNAELLDAFAYDSVNFGANNSQSVTLKVGRQTLLWGQSLFFTGNGIAAGQAPVDVNKALTLANPQAQQVFLPVGQAVLTYQPNNWITLQGYYQFEWRPYQLPGAGSYFAPSDFIVPGGGALIANGPAFFGSPPIYFARQHDITPPSNNGQFGISAKFQLGNYDLGLYALRFDDKTPQFYIAPTGPSAPPQFTSLGVNFGHYNVVYARDIQLYGASLSTTLGPVNVAGEISTRRNQDLDSNPATETPGLNENTNPGYAVGNTLNGQASAIYLTPGLPFMPGGMTMLGEVEANSVLRVTKNKAQLVPGRTPEALGFQFVVAPNYYDVLPDLDLNFPVGVTWYPTGRSQFSGQMQAGTGQLNLGVTATYRAVWTGGVNYSDYLGSTSIIAPGNTKQIFADRGYVSFYVSRTF